MLDREIMHFTWNKKTSSYCMYGLGQHRILVLSPPKDLCVITHWFPSKSTGSSKRLFLLYVHRILGDLITGVHGLMRTPNFPNFEIGEVIPPNTIWPHAHWSLITMFEAPEFRCWQKDHCLTQLLAALPALYSCNLSSTFANESSQFFFVHFLILLLQAVTW